MLEMTAVLEVKSCYVWRVVCYMQEAWVRVRVCADGVLGFLWIGDDTNLVVDD